ncbi:MAG: YabP/YqfC family sporulation protein [Clostridia bacterium]|nr:YabP/YqfC family sporulation protein [Clostridia bacterium]
MGNLSAESAVTVKTAHSIQTDRRKRTVVTGVADICSFHETEIVLKLENGHVFLTGQDLHIDKLLPEENRLDINGQIDSIVYEAPRKHVAGWMAFLKKHS